MKYWEIIADNLRNAGWSWGCVATIDSNGQQSGLLTHIATTESGSLCVLMKADGVFEIRSGDFAEQPIA